MDPSSIFIVGANGQLGKALRDKYPKANKADFDELDITKIDSVNNYDWSKIKIIINAAAYTDVDKAETSIGRVSAWNVNAFAVSNLVRVAQKHGIILIHISTDYVFDGTKAPHNESELISPINVYGQSKAAGDLAVSLIAKHYIFRTSWVIGEGKNFVRTMIDIGKKNINPTVVADQKGRLTFTCELVKAIDYILNTKADFGTYNISNGGIVASWADVTRSIFEFAGLKLKVKDTTTNEYYNGKENIAPRPLRSDFNLSKIQATGFKLTDWRIDLKDYIKKEMEKV